MIFFPDEKNIEEKLYEHEIEELREYAEKNGFSDQEVKEFIKRSIIDELKSKYDGIGATEKEVSKMVLDALERLNRFGIEL